MSTNNSYLRAEGNGTGFKIEFSLKPGELIDIFAYTIRAISDGENISQEWFFESLRKAIPQVQGTWKKLKDEEPIQIG